MEESVSVTPMGLILCKHCHEIIDTLDTEKVTIYYSECLQEHCNDRDVSASESLV